MAPRPSSRIMRYPGIGCGCLRINSRQAEHRDVEGTFEVFAPAIGPSQAPQREAKVSETGWRTDPFLGSSTPWTGTGFSPPEMTGISGLESAAGAGVGMQT